jgi:signal transduction histidine kinase
MIISQMVLILFVGQWLWMVFVKERDRFDQEFSRKFQESEMTVVDSMLMVKVLDPMMKESSYRRMTMNITLDSVDLDHPNWQGTKIFRDLRTDSCEQVIAIATTDSFPFPPNQDPARYLPLNINDAVFLQGMKLVVQRIEDSLSLSDRNIQRTFILKDTSRIKKLFAGTLREVDPSIRIVWTTDQPPWDTTSVKGGRFYYEMPAQGYTLAATIKNPFLVVLKETVPSILFAIALLILTGLSFVIAFRSLKSQIQLNRIRSDFMSNITHELKTPVSTVKVALEALKRFNSDSDPAKAGEYLTMASREMDRLDQLISQVLQSSMHDNGVQLIEKEGLDLRFITADVIESLQPRMERLGATIVVEEPQGSCMIRADRLHLQGVLMNLLENSLNYGGDHPAIRIRIAVSAQETEFIVSDNGPGIPEEYMEKVFDKFFRVPSGDRHNVKGYGLGLSYAAMVMKLHGGTIRAENIREGGVRFILTFPNLPA